MDEIDTLRLSNTNQLDAHDSLPREARNSQGVRRLSERPSSFVTIESILPIGINWDKDMDISLAADAEASEKRIFVSGNFLLMQLYLSVSMPAKLRLDIGVPERLGFMYPLCSWRTPYGHHVEDFELADKISCY